MTVVSMAHIASCQHIAGQMSFWIGENSEPVRIRVTVKRPEKNATKFWLLSDGGCKLAHNASEIPA